MIFSNNKKITKENVLKHLALLLDYKLNFLKHIKNKQKLMHNQNT